MIDPGTGAMVSRIEQRFLSDELQVMLTTGQKHVPLTPDVQPHRPYSIPALPTGRGAQAAQDPVFQAQLNRFIAARMADPTRRAFIAFTPYNQLTSAANQQMKRSARSLAATDSGVTLLVNPISRHLEAYDMATQTVSQFRVRDLDPHIAFDVLRACTTAAARTLYNEGMARVMAAFGESKRRIGPPRQPPELY